MADRDVELRIGADGSQAESEFSKVASAAEKAGRSIYQSLREAHYNAAAASQASVNSMKTAFAGLHESVQKINLSLSFMTAGMMAGLSVKSVVETASTFEQLEIRLNAVMGSAKDGEEAFNWIKQFAVNTPHSVQQTTDAFMQLKNFGLDPMDGTLQKVADASAKYGKSADTAQRVTLALGQAWARGKLQGQDTLQMIDAGIPVYDLLSKTLGKTAAEIQIMSEKGEMGRDIMRKLIDQMGVEGAGASAAKMHSFAGAVSNMGDAFENSIDKLRKQGGFGFITEGVLKFTDVIPPMVTVSGEAFATVGTVIKSLWSVVSETFSAIGKTLAATFGTSSEGMTAIDLFTNSLKVIQVSLISLRAGFQTVFGFIKTMLEATFNHAVGFAAALNKALTLDFSGAKATWRDAVSESRSILDKGFSDIVKDAEQARVDIDQAILGQGETAKVADHKVDDSKNTKAVDANKIATWKAELEQRKEVEGNFFKTSLAEDEAFWQKKLVLAKGNAKDEAAVRHELYTIHKQMAVQKFNDEQEALKNEIAAARAGSAERIALATKAAQHVGETYGWESKEYLSAIREIKKAADEFDKEQQKLDVMKVERAKEHSVAMIGMERDRIAFMKNLGQIDDGDEIAALRKLKEHEYQIEVKAQQDKIALMKEEGPARQQQLDELAKMQDKHDAGLAKLDQQRVLVVKKQWETALGAVNGAFEQSINGMIQGTQTLQKAMANIGQAITAEFVKLGVKRVTTWIANEAAMMAATKAKDTAVTASGTAVAASGMAKNVATSTAVITNEAAVAGAGITANTAPMAGPLALGIGAAGMAAVMALLGNLKSSAGGEWRVPHDRLNIVHKDETILPAREATSLRNMVEGGGSSGGGTHLHIHAAVADAKGFETWLKANSSVLAPAMRNLNRDFFKL